MGMKIKESSGDGYNPVFSHTRMLWVLMMLMVVGLEYLDSMLNHGYHYGIDSLCYFLGIFILRNSNCTKQGLRVGVNLLASINLLNSGHVIDPCQWGNYILLTEHGGICILPCYFCFLSFLCRWLMIMMKQYCNIWRISLHRRFTFLVLIYAWNFGCWWLKGSDLKGRYLWDKSCRNWIMIVCYGHSFYSVLLGFFKGDDYVFPGKGRSYKGDIVHYTFFPSFPCDRIKVIIMILTTFEIGIMLFRYEVWHKSWMGTKVKESRMRNDNSIEELCVNHQGFFNGYLPVNIPLLCRNKRLSNWLISSTFFPWIYWLTITDLDWRNSWNYQFYWMMFFAGHWIRFMLYWWVGMEERIGGCDTKGCSWIMLTMRKWIYWFHRSTAMFYKGIKNGAGVWDRCGTDKQGPNGKDMQNRKEG